ncbi:hypothetical protein OHAE_1534 [Ochrobactrum soli]|uniref:Uncharacterized protein n=1 Tax=Ochrobactrum soli TaxID=2448455 RepID=A0A2P9HNK0_9HYPH|nr:hypothetical protein OHAE_1534 [[Ochrobactrum] soli]
MQSRAMSAKNINWGIALERRCHMSRNEAGFEALRQVR